MVKFGLRLAENRAEEYPPEAYVDYDGLKEIIGALAGKKLARVDSTAREVSLTAPPPTTAAGRQLTSADSPVTEEDFYSRIDAELAKVERFTLQKVTELRSDISALEGTVAGLNRDKDEDGSASEKVRERADEVAKSFLVLEKYVNVNFMGFHKILKKHDKNSPAHTCKQFYINRMHAQAWVRGDYSDVVVRLSAVYSALRNDHAAEENRGDAQSFLRSTTKYWVRTEDVSKVKYAVLKHLPVFLQKTSTGESDSQLTNSVYFDNDQLELYHGRLDKMPGAIAFRLRWYGAGDPTTVFCERKTHRDTWTGEASVKERFIIHESEVKQVLNDRYPVAQKQAEMLSKKKGATQAEVDDWETLVNEMIQVVQTKQLVPTMRTQYMRTAFQIPFDATVRISLDTNLCMISERGYDTQGGAKWYRDPEKPLADNEITRFPHAILEVKLELGGANTEPPQWVTDLQNSGMLYEVHKFSKFIHGCATLLPEYVRSVPYWVDDASIRESILRSGGGRILVKGDSDTGVGPGANEIYNHLLPFGNVKEPKLDAKGRTANTAALVELGKKDAGPLAITANKYYASADETDEEILFNATVQGCFEDTCAGWLFPFCSAYNSEEVMAPTSVQKIEPKIFLANERTFLHWLHAGVTLYTIAAGILAFASDTHSVSAHWYAMALLPISLGFCLYALHLFLWRAEKIKTRIPGRWDDSRGPLILGAILAGVLFVNFVLKCREIRRYNYAMAHEL